MSDVLRLVSAERVARHAADLFLERGRAAVQAKGRFDVALSGGSTPAAMYDVLAERVRAGEANLNWRRVHFFWGDERFVPPDHEDSNYFMAYRRLLSVLDVDESCVHRVRTELGDPHEAARDYERQIVEHFKLSSSTDRPRFDLVFLGLGTDAHTASLFPYTDALYDLSHHVTANRVGDAWRITFTYCSLNAAAHVLFLVTGASKAEALRNVFSSAYRPSLFPAQGVRPLDGSVRWLIDENAAAAAGIFEADT